MSLLTPEKVPVGFAPGKRWAGRDLAKEKISFPRFGNIPASKTTLWLLALRYLPSLITKSPIVLESEGHGPEPYQGNVVLLVDRHTASAAEMVTIFAKENRLATIVGERTAGRLAWKRAFEIFVMLCVAFIFAVAHARRGIYLELTIIAGIVYGLCRWKSGSVIPAIVCHSVFNALVMWTFGR